MSYDDEECVRPPHGWKCSRGNGHPGPCAARPAEDVDLIERCVHAARTASGSFLRDPEVNRDEYWDYVVRAVLSQVDAAQSPAPITALDVSSAQLAWGRMPYTEQREWNLDRGGRTAFIAHHLNQRGQVG